MNKLELEVLHRYALTSDQVGEALDEVGWSRATARWSFAMPDGRFACVLYGQGNADVSRPFALALFGAKTTTVLPVEPPAVPKELWDFSAFPYSDQIIFLRGTRSLTAISTIEPYSSAKWSVINDITERDSNSPQLAVRPRPESQITATTDVAAIPLDGMRDGQRLGFLMLDLAAKQARWTPWPRETSQRFRSVLSSIFDPKTLKEASYRRLAHLPSIEHWDDPQYGLNQPVEDHAFAKINQAAVSEAGVLVFTNGHDMPHHGRFCSSLSVIDQEGHVAKRLFHQQYDRDDPKKRGVSARFTTSGRYVVLAHFYKSTDEWSGQQKLLDLTTGELIDLVRPRGMSRFRMVDHAADTFWLKAIDVVEGCSLVSCRQRQSPATSQ